MNISSHEEYGLRCALQLAREFGKGPISASKIAEREGISVEYVSKFMHIFRKAMLTKSIRGTQGGFQLAKAPEEINLAEIVEALNPAKKPISSSFCGNFSGQKDVCVNIDSCSIRSLWSLVTIYFDSVLRQLMLSELLNSESLVQQRVEDLITQNIREHRGMRETKGLAENEFARG